jgi:hypothetical protein
VTVQECAVSDAMVRGTPDEVALWNAIVVSSEVKEPLPTVDDAASAGRARAAPPLRVAGHWQDAGTQLAGIVPISQCGASRSTRTG